MPSFSLFTYLCVRFGLNDKNADVFDAKGDDHTARTLTTVGLFGRLIC